MDCCEHWFRAPWDRSRWPDFSPHGLACPCCGEICARADALHAIQRLRTAMGAQLGQHKTFAFDVVHSRHDLMRLERCAHDAGFTGFGFGNTFLHIDTRAPGPGRARPPRNGSDAKGA